MKQLKWTIASFPFPSVVLGLTVFMFPGDMELKQNKSLPAEKQIITADPDITTVCRTFFSWNELSGEKYLVNLA